MNEIDDMMRRVALSNYNGQVCPHCGQPVMIAQTPDPIISAGGKYNPKYKCVAHPTCFYIHEASDAWRKKWSQYAPR